MLIGWRYQILPKVVNPHHRYPSPGTLHAFHLQAVNILNMQTTHTLYHDTMRHREESMRTKGELRKTHQWYMRTESHPKWYIRTRSPPKVVRTRSPQKWYVPDFPQSSTYVPDRPQSGTYQIAPKVVRTRSPPKWYVPDHPKSGTYQITPKVVRTRSPPKWYMQLLCNSKPNDQKLTYHIANLPF